MLCAITSHLLLGKTIIFEYFFARGGLWGEGLRIFGLATTKLSYRAVTRLSRPENQNTNGDQLRVKMYRFYVVVILHDYIVSSSCMCPSAEIPPCMCPSPFLFCYACHTPVMHVPLRREPVMHVPVMPRTLRKLCA